MAEKDWDVKNMNTPAQDFENSYIDFKQKCMEFIYKEGDFVLFEDKIYKVQRCVSTVELKGYYILVDSYGNCGAEEYLNLEERAKLVFSKERVWELVEDAFKEEIE